MSSVSRITIALAGGVVAVGLSAAPALAAGNTSSTGLRADYGVGNQLQQTAPQVLPKTIRRAPAVTKVTKVAAVVQPTGALAYTGSDAIVGGLAIGSALVLVGGVLVVGTRRRGAAA